MIRLLYWTMVIALSGGLVGAFALGFGEPVPVRLVIGAICVGTASMVALLIRLAVTAKAS